MCVLAWRKRPLAKYILQTNDYPFERPHTVLQLGLYFCLPNAWYIPQAFNIYCIIGLFWWRFDSWNGCALAKMDQVFWIVISSIYYKRCNIRSLFYKPISICFPRFCHLRIGKICVHSYCWPVRTEISRYLRMEWILQDFIFKKLSFKYYRLVLQR